MRQKSHGQYCELRGWNHQYCDSEDGITSIVSSEDGTASTVSSEDRNASIVSSGNGNASTVSSEGGNQSHKVQSPIFAVLSFLNLHQFCAVKIWSLGWLVLWWQETMLSLNKCAL